VPDYAPSDWTLLGMILTYFGTDEARATLDALAFSCRLEYEADQRRFVRFIAAARLHHLDVDETQLAAAAATDLLGCIERHEYLVHVGYTHSCFGDNRMFAAMQPAVLANARIDSVCIPHLNDCRYNLGLFRDHARDMVIACVRSNRFRHIFVNCKDALYGKDRGKGAFLHRLCDSLQANTCLQSIAILPELCDQRPLGADGNADASADFINAATSQIHTLYLLGSPPCYDHIVRALIKGNTTLQRIVPCWTTTIYSTELPVELVQLLERNQSLAMLGIGLK